MPNDMMSILINLLLTTHQEFSACVQASPVHFPNGSPRVCRNSIPVSMSPDGARVIPRRRQVKIVEIDRFCYAWKMTHKILLLCVCSLVWST